MDLFSFLITGFSFGAILILCFFIFVPGLLEWRYRRKKSEAYRLARAHLVRSKTRR